MTVWVRFESGEKAVFELTGDNLQDRSHLYLARIIEEESGETVRCLMHLVK